jgi:hypothetical protein
MPDKIEDSDDDPKAVTWHPASPGSHPTSSDGNAGNLQNAVPALNDPNSAKRDAVFDVSAQRASEINVH